MPPSAASVEVEPTSTQKALSDARLAAAGYNLTSLARELVTADDDPVVTKRRVASKVRLLQKYRDATAVPSPATALDLSRKLGGEVSDYRPARLRAADWRAVVERRLGEIEELVRQLQPLLEERPAPRKRKA